MKPVDVKSSTHIDHDVENNDKDPKLKISDNAGISNYSYNPYCPEKSWRYCEDIVGTFYEKDLQKTDQAEFRIKRLVEMWKLISMYP